MGTELLLVSYRVWAKPPKNTLLQVIPTLTYYFDVVVSDIIWKYIWHICFVFDIFSGILSDIHSNILSGILCSIVSGMGPGVHPELAIFMAWKDKADIRWR